MPIFTLGDVTFDTAANPAAIVHGYDRTSRGALADEHLIKVRDLAVKTNLSARLTKGLQVTTYNPSDLKDSSNFFNFVSQWEAIILSFETHFKTYFMETPFTLYEKVETPLTPNQHAVYEFELQTFLANSAVNGGTPYQYIDPTTGGPVDRPDPPEPAVTIQVHHAGSNLLRAWHTKTFDEVLTSVELIVSYVNETVDRQNLSWTFQYLMDCLDADLKAFVLSKIAHLDPQIGRSGPVVFMIVAQRMLQTTENLAQKVINGLIALRLTHFDSESVVEAIFTVRNVLKFLRYGEPNTFAPRTTIVLVYDVFRGSSVGVFRAYVQQAQDIVLKDETNIEVIFDHLQAKYEELLLADRWVPTKKKQSAFVLGEPATRTYVDADKDKSPSQKPPPKEKKERPTHDKSGKKIDYTPPKRGEPHERTVDGVKEYWCGHCGRWGSHPTDKHEEWRANYKNRRNNKKKNGDGNGNNNNGNGTPSANATADASRRAPGTRATPRGSVTFLSALTGNPTVSFAVDPELADGIDF